MAQQVLLPSRLIVILAVLFFGCHREQSDGKRTISSVLLNKNGADLTMDNGLVFSGGKPFTGRLYILFQGTKDTAEISSYLDGREHGKWEKFFQGHKRKELRYFKNGQKTGLYQAWWENGKRQLEYSFSEDEYEGTCREWNEKGELSRIMNYRKGYEEGPQKWWYDGGKMKANYIIKDGRRYGLLGTKNCINVSDSIFKN